MSEVMNASSYYFDTATATHNGRVRKINEDSLFASAERGIWLVADGMGGHKDGNIASGMIADAAQTMSKSAAETNLPAMLREEIAEVNNKLVAISNLSHDSIVGSTVVALLMNGNRYDCLWAGDSRCYLVRDGEISRVSHDHTEVQELVDRGVLTEAEARTWPRRNVITRAIGADHQVELDSCFGTVKAGDTFVLCSDGLTGHLEDHEILGAVQTARPKEACNALLATALERGGKDNISIIVVNAVLRESTTVVQWWK